MLIGNKITCYTNNIFKISRRQMNSKIKKVLTPVGVRGMTQLDRNKFALKTLVPILKVEHNSLNKVIPICKKYFLKLEHFKPVQRCDQSPNTVKCVHLNPEIIIKWMDICEGDQKDLMKYDVCERNFDVREVQLSYDNWNMEKIFKAVLPDEEETVSGFSQIGHVVHLNLREHLLPYKNLIGSVLIDKIKSCRTVVHKKNVINNTYRNFDLELLAGEPDYMVTVKENGCSFRFDFSQVYWNPRLAKEHERILAQLHQGNILFDVFCGVGPFAIPAAKKKCKVFANDLNPDAFKWLNQNAIWNKLNVESFKSFNCDGKYFICNIMKDFLVNCIEDDLMSNECLTVHVTMNLPASAVDFLKYFKGLLDDCSSNSISFTVIVHVYCFAIGDDPCGVAKRAVQEIMGSDISENIIEIFNVRNVAPNKEMMRVTFKLSDQILITPASAKRTNNCEAMPSKKICI